MDSNIAATFRYYDRRGQRLGVFCRFINETEAEIYTLACSHDDQFNKNFARQVYIDYLKTGRSFYVLDGLPDSNHAIEVEAHPTITTVTVVPEEREVQTLIRYCKDNYFYEIHYTIYTEHSLLTNKTYDNVKNH